MKQIAFFPRSFGSCGPSSMSQRHDLDLPVDIFDRIWQGRNPFQARCWRRSFFLAEHAYPFLRTGSRFFSNATPWPRVSGELRVASVSNAMNVFSSYCFKVWLVSVGRGLGPLLRRNGRNGERERTPPVGAVDEDTLEVRPSARRGPVGKSWCKKVGPVPRKLRAGE